MIYVYITRGEGWESRRLLGRALRDWGAPVGRLEHDPRGKPYVPGGPEISISHSDGVVVVALAKEPVGVDIQRHRPIRENLPRRVLSQPEYDWYAARGCQNRDFFALWALKESYYKYLGTGLPGIPNGTEFQRVGEFWSLKEDRSLYVDVWQSETLSLALCGREEGVTFRGFPESLG